MHCTCSQFALLEQSKVRKTGFTDPGRINQDRIEHARQIALRTADDLEHVGGGDLLLQGFAQFAEQPRILDGDDGLRGEIADKLDLLVGEWLHLLPIHINGADKLVVFEHWHRYKCPHACGFDKRNDAVVFSDVGRVGPEVGDVDNLLGIGDTIEGNSRSFFQLNHTITPPKIDVALLAMVDSYAAKTTSLV